jgi:hypothetical protein
MMSPDDIKHTTPPVCLHPNAMTSSGPTRAEAVAHLGTVNPSDDDISKALTTLAYIQKQVQDIGDKMVRNQLYVNAKEKRMKNAANSGVVSSFTDMVLSFRERPTIHSCQVIYEAVNTWTFLDEMNKNEWMLSMETRILGELNITYSRSPNVGELTFILAILKKKCLGNARNMFAGSKNTVGLTMKKEARHPLGPAPPGCCSHEFHYQNIKNWELLCKYDTQAQNYEKARMERFNGNDLPSDTALHIFKSTGGLNEKAVPRTAVSFPSKMQVSQDSIEVQAPSMQDQHPATALISSPFSTNSTVKDVVSEFDTTSNMYPSCTLISLSNNTKVNLMFWLADVVTAYACMV